MPTRTTTVCRTGAQARDQATAVLRSAAAHVVAELTNPRADLRTLIHQVRQSAGLAEQALDGSPPGPPSRHK